MTGRAKGRGQSKNVENVDLADARIELDRQQQLEAARIMGMPESEIPIRGRGGFRPQELRTIPDNVQEVRVKNLQALRQVDVVCNYVPLQKMGASTVHMYRVDFEPEVESVMLMRRLYNLAAAQAFTRRPIYDGAHECRSGQHLTETTPVEVTGDNDDKYIVKFTHTGVAQFGMEMLRIYNSHMRRFLETLGFYSPQPRCFVHPQFRTPVGNDIMMLRGYSTSANMFDENRMMMNLEPCHKIVQLGNVLQMMSQISRNNPTNVQESIRSELREKLVVTGYNKRCYKIDDVDFDSNPTSSFKTKDGREITFIDYFRTAHRTNIQVTTQALLVAVPNNQRRRDETDIQIKLIPELCNIAGLTNRQRNDNRLKMDLIRASQVAPNERVANMREFLTRFHANQEIKNELANWGYSYGDAPLQVKAHILAQNRVGYGPAAKQPMESWAPVNMEHANFDVTGLANIDGPIKKMAIITTRRDLQDKPEILARLRGGFDRVGLRIENVHQVDVPEGDSSNHYCQKLRLLPKDVTVALVIMNSQNKERYDAIKKVASVEMGLITQVVTAKLMKDPRKASGAAVKIAIQVAAKVGGEPWYINIPMKASMVCGFDTYHDTARRGRSHGAFVASMNNRYSKWWSKADEHDSLNEMSGAIGENLLEALKKYRELNGAQPERVIIYRDGVGEGQLEQVFNVELKRVKNIITEVDKRIKLTMIIVNKRIGARFYMKAQSGFVNPPPGTIVDHGCTRRERFDFYLISQSTRQGTVTPTYYNIIEDESGFSPEIHQRMAYKFCLLYYNWSGSVRVPAPCQYAHKLALLCGENLHSQPSSVLDNRLHFL